MPTASGWSRRSLTGGAACRDPAPAPRRCCGPSTASPLGPSAAGGGQLQGVPWPDDPGTYRSAPVDAGMAVTERWRCGDPLADFLQGTEPAGWSGDAVRCPVSGAGRR